MEINFSLASDFIHGGLDNGQFQSEIRANSDISVLCTHINTDGDTVSVFFNDTLANSEVTVLDSLVALHTPIPTYNLIGRFSPKTTDVKTSNYTSIGTFYLTNVLHPIKKIDIVSYMDSTAVSFTVKLVYRSTNTTIGHGTFNNSSFDINSITTIDYAPTEIGLIDVLATRTSSVPTATAYISDIVLWG